MTPEQEMFANCACHRLKQASRAVTRAYDDALRPTGLRATQLALLAAAAVEEAISITELAATIGLERSTLTRNLAPLAADGLIVVGNEGHRRSRMVRITPEGRRRMRTALPLWRRAQEALRNKLGAARWGSIDALAGKLAGSG
jgi:DNA-binding MarR family transcriptional regulator